MIGRILLAVLLISILYTVVKFVMVPSRMYEIFEYFEEGVSGGRPTWYIYGFIFIVAGSYLGVLQALGVLVIFEILNFWIWKYEVKTGKLQAKKEKRLNEFAGLTEAYK